MWFDLRQATRGLLKSPGFTLIVVATLAIALGANFAVFSVMDTVLLRELPYSEPDRIVDVSVLLPPAEGRPGRKALLEHAYLERWREHAQTVVHLAAYRTEASTLTGHGEPVRVEMAGVSPALFPLLRVSPALGRTFREEESQSGRERVTVLSHRLWWERYAGIPAMIGRSVTLNGESHTVIGVMPRGFAFPQRTTDLWTPLTVATPSGSQTEVLAVDYFLVIGRLAPGVSLEQAEAEAQTIFQSFTGEVTRLAREAFPEGARVRVVPLREAMTLVARPALLALSAAVGLVLLVACINLANLLLARGMARRGEMAIRMAMGANRARVVRLLLTESIVLSFAGAVAGVLVAGLILRLLPRIVPHDIPRIEEIGLDVRVYLFALLLCGLTGLLFAVAPTLHSTRAGQMRLLHGVGLEAPADRRSRNLLVIVEVALAFVVVMGAGLLLRSYLHLVQVELGFEPKRTVMVSLVESPRESRRLD